jgi:hypothetical protein
MWVARWRENVIQPDGGVIRVLRSEILGPVSEITSRREARILIQRRLVLLNSGQRGAEATMTFGNFVTERFEPDILPTLKYATQKSYSLLLRTHLLPRFRDSRLCDITRAGVQQFITGKLKDGYAWENKQNIARPVCKQPAAKLAQSFPFLGQAVCHDLVEGHPVQADSVAGIKSSEERRNVRSAPV